MNVNGVGAVSYGGAADAAQRTWEQSRLPTAAGVPAHGSPEVLKEKFNDFVAGTFYKTMLAALRKTVNNKSLIHGGRAEEIFRSQLDQTIAERMAKSHGAGLSAKMFEQFTRTLASKESAPATGAIDLDEPNHPRPVPGRTL